MANVDTNVQNVVDKFCDRFDRPSNQHRIKMSKADYLQAVTMIATSFNAKAQYNVCVDNHISSTYDILLLECNAALIDKLVTAGYSLAMTPKGLSVAKI